MAAPSAVSDALKHRAKRFVQSIPSADACAALSLEVTRQIAIVAKTNILGGATIIKDGEELTVVAGPQGTREIARVRCA